MIDWSTISLRDLAGYISEELRKRGIDTILVGGACVTIYSEKPVPVLRSRLHHVVSLKKAAGRAVL